MGDEGGTQRPTASSDYPFIVIPSDFQPIFSFSAKLSETRAPPMPSPFFDSPRFPPKDPGPPVDPPNRAFQPFFSISSWMVS